jgi:rare lipoprotein A
VNQQGNYKVRLGPFPTDAAARSAAESLKVSSVVLNN